MKKQAKIQLSTLEMELVTNSEWILTKNGIMQKAWLLLEHLQELQQDVLVQSKLPKEVLTPSPKISKGENYKGLPYLVLDQPRYFNKEDVFVIRTMFWWGHFFSSTLQLSGNYKEMYEDGIIRSFSSLQEAGYFVCLNMDPWEHDFGTDNYTSLHEITAIRFEGMIKQHPFIKLSTKISLQEWEVAEEKLLEVFRRYTSLF